jgi:hypothetical protein
MLGIRNKSATKDAGKTHASEGQDPEFRLGIRVKGKPSALVRSGASRSSGSSLSLMLELAGLRNLQIKVPVRVHGGFTFGHLCNL